MEIKYKKLGDLSPYENNARTHSEEQVAQICASIREFGFTNPLLIDENGGIIAGHGRLAAAKILKMDEVPTIELKGLSEAQKRAYIIADNQLALNAGWNEELLKEELEALQNLDFDLELTGFSEDEINELLGEDLDFNGSGAGVSGSLSDKFLLPPFSVFNARLGWWQDRKRSWLNMGIDSGAGRNSGMQKAMNSLLEKVGGASAATASNDSIFDPVLAELIYGWFSPKGGVVLDPFAGGSVRGIVAARLGRAYVGGELRKEQVEANVKQAKEIIKSDEPMPVWVNADSRLIDKTCKDVKADLIFSCPPYADLEKYSDDPADLSNMPYVEFKKAYYEIIAKSCTLLKDNRFAAFVVGEVRDKKGNYYNFVADTVEAFRAAGLEYYNEAILVTSCGSLALRARNYFETSRKLGKTHQNVLIFLKGDAKKATADLGVCEFGEFEDDNG